MFFITTNIVNTCKVDFFFFITISIQYREKSLYFAASLRSLHLYLLFHLSLPNDILYGMYVLRL